jgi:hypothetical protein
MGQTRYIIGVVQPIFSALMADHGQNALNAANSQLIAQPYA